MTTAPHTALREFTDHFVPGFVLLVAASAVLWVDIWSAETGLAAVFAIVAATIAGHAIDAIADRLFGGDVGWAPDLTPPFGRFDADEIPSIPTGADDQSDDHTLEAVRNHLGVGTEVPDDELLELLAARQRSREGAVGSLEHLATLYRNLFAALLIGVTLAVLATVPSILGVAVVASTPWVLGVALASAALAVFFYNEAKRYGHRFVETLVRDAIVASSPA